MEKYTFYQGIQETYIELGADFAVDSEIDWTFQWKLHMLITYSGDYEEFYLLGCHAV
jgi:hypothetical protein